MRKKFMLFTGLIWLGTAVVPVMAADYHRWPAVAPAAWDSSTQTTAAGEQEAVRSEWRRREMTPDERRDPAGWSEAAPGRYRSGGNGAGDGFRHRQKGDSRFDRQTSGSGPGGRHYRHGGGRAGGHGRR